MRTTAEVVTAGDVTSAISEVAVVVVVVASALVAVVVVVVVSEADTGAVVVILFAVVEDVTAVVSAAEGSVTSVTALEGCASAQEAIDIIIEASNNDAVIFFILFFLSIPFSFTALYILKRTKLRKSDRIFKKKISSIFSDKGNFSLKKLFKKVGIGGAASDRFCIR